MESRKIGDKRVYLGKILVDKGEKGDYNKMKCRFLRKAVRVKKEEVGSVLPAGFGAAPEHGRFRTDCVGWEGLGSPHRKKGNRPWKLTARS